MRKFIIILLLCVIPFLQGCAVFIASQLGYYEAKSKYSKLYNNYKLEKEKINVEKGRYGLAPEPVKAFAEWLKEQPLTRNEIKVFRMRGVISTEDAKDMLEEIKTPTSKR